MTRPLHVAFVWHMHQPYYKDDLSNSFLLPWVRLRAAKDYYKMPALLDGYPDVKLTFNLVPALVEQIQDYVDGGVQDVYMELARRPVSGLSADERGFVARWMTESGQIRRVRQYPRYLELVRKREQAGPPTAGGLATLFSDAELRDLLVWFNLSWIGPEAMEDNPEIAELVRKGRFFSDADVEPVLRVQFELLRKVLPKYRELQERGQAELITSPYYHPRPDLKMPRAMFKHADDAAEQLRLGIEAHRRHFGRRPRGVWPPEAAVSEDVVRLAADHRLEWMLSDEGVLSRSLASPIIRDAQGQVAQPEQLYTPYRVQGNDPPIHLVFRDAPLSNAIGFEYQNSPADEAAADLVRRLRAIQERQQDRPLLAVIALDGENCWDSYEANGNPFLHSLYSRLSREPDLKTVTVSEFIAEFPAEHALSRIHPGSWINANFDTWVGDAEHNVAWDLLAQARDFLSERERAADDHEQLASARREALIAQGSDWFWWFGRSHDSGMDQIWDSLFRLHLRNIYMSLKRTPPAELYRPIANDTGGSASKRPHRKITPKLNGVVDQEEWEAGGYVDVSALFGAMHPPTGAVRRIWFGHDDRNLYLRFDLLPTGRPRPVELEIFFSGSPKQPSNANFGFDPALRLTAKTSGADVELEPIPARRSRWWRSRTKKASRENNSLPPDRSRCAYPVMFFAGARTSPSRSCSSRRKSRPSPRWAASPTSPVRYPRRSRRWVTTCESSCRATAASTSRSTDCDGSSPTWGCRSPTSRSTRTSSKDGSRARCRSTSSTTSSSSAATACTDSGTTMRASSISAGPRSRCCGRSTSGPT
ncbi:MAG: glycoside hydrolase [Chloroflexi bacterium]|nr:MAG: glycoside hydrolase [Chloroflexota bacterium]